MQELKKELFDSLYKWTTDLLNHQSNPVKTPLENTIISFDELRVAHQEKNEFMNQLHDEYEKNHNVPRLEKEERYNQFCQAQLELLSEWKKTPNRNIMNDIVKLERDIEPYDTLYTMYGPKYS